MLLPAKHIRVAESFLGLGAFVLRRLSKPRTLDELWLEVEKQRRKGKIVGNHSFENLVTAVSLLFALGAVKLRPDGGLERCA